MRVLVVDVGGNSVKAWDADSGEKRKFSSGKQLTPQDMVSQAREASADWKYDVVALGLPCHIRKGRPCDEPHNLGSGWVDFDYEAAFERPVRIMNDANLQALGCYQGGRMLFIGLGTAVGSTLISDRVILSLELGQLPHTDGKETVQLLGRDARKEQGLERWEAAVHEIIPRLAGAVVADDVVIGGGQAEKLNRLPDGARLGGNHAVVQGGLRLWQELPDPTQQADFGPWRLA